MLTGKAVGGPRDGVRLSAGVSWDGRVALKREGNTGSSTLWHPGRYVWQDETWTWQPSEPQQRCPRCGMHKGKDAYNWAAWGLPGNRCRDCNAEYHLERKQRMRQNA